MDETGAVAAFAALAQGTRLAMFRKLAAAGCAGLPAGDVAKAVGASPSRASFHLAALTDAGLIRPSRAARQVIYRVDFEMAGALLGFLLRDCCRDEPALRRGAGLDPPIAKEG